MSKIVFYELAWEQYLYWQRCKVHFMRNILAHVPQKDKERGAARLKLIWQAPDEKSARAMKAAFC